MAMKQMAMNARWEAGKTQRIYGWSVHESCVSMHAAPLSTLKHAPLRVLKQYCACSTQYSQAVLCLLHSVLKQYCACSTAARPRGSSYTITSIWLSGMALPLAARDLRFGVNCGTKAIRGVGLGLGLGLGGMKYGVL